MAGVDLNKLRETMSKSQLSNDPLPMRRDDKVFVDPEGQIRHGRDVRPGEERRLSEVHQGVFACANERVADKEGGS